MCAAIEVASADEDDDIDEEDVVHGTWREFETYLHSRGLGVQPEKPNSTNGLRQQLVGFLWETPRDRKSVVSGKSVSVRVDLGGRRIINKKKRAQTTLRQRSRSKVNVCLITDRYGSTLNIQQNQTGKES